MIDLFLLAQVSPDIHKTCLEAKDYLGCVEVISGKQEKTIPKNSFNGFEKNDLNEECGAEGWCIAKRGKDILGMPKIIGWLYREYPQENEVTYLSPLPLKVNVRGEFGRYIHTTTILRYYKKPKAGTPGRVVGGGYADTNCYGVGNTFNCTTTSAPVYTIPGKSSEPGGNVQKKFDYLIDCKDFTFETLIDNKGGRWKPLANTFLEKDAKMYCSGSIHRLSESSITKYSKGKKK